MPGSKRNKLKKLLSPNSTPNSSVSPGQVFSPGQVLSPPPLEGIPPPVITADDVACTEQDVREQEEQSILDEMRRREGTVGSGMDLSQRDEMVSPTGTPVFMSPTPTPVDPAGSGSTGSKKKSSRQRFEEREARKQAAMLAANPEGDGAAGAEFEREKEEEAQVVGGACAILGRAIHEIAPDGHCMYSAIADQLAMLGEIPPDESQNPIYIRTAAADYMLQHADDFMPFLPSVAGEDASGAGDDGIMTEARFKTYCDRVVSSGDWGGEPEIQALSRKFQLPIHVIQRGPPTIVSHGGGTSTDGAMTPEQSKAEGNRVVRISYHRRMYGLGEHYNSLRPV